MKPDVKNLSKMKAAAPMTPPAPPKFFSLIPKTNFNFVKYRHVFYGISLFLTLGPIALLALRGAPLGVDFTGGVVIQFDAPGASIEAVRGALEGVGLSGSVQSLDQPGQYIARFKKEDEEKGLDARFAQALGNIVPSGGGQVLSKDFVGAVVGEKLTHQALMAIFLSFAGISIYVGFRFRNLIWGVAGVIAIIHDVLSTIGFLVIMGHELDLVIVAALLTIAGYSINDTVVIFDRLRERLRVYTREVLSDAINKSLNETMSRTILTSGTVFFVTAMLAAFGGRSIHPFAVAMLFGTIIGIYSTVGVAINLVYSWSQWTGQRMR